MRYTEIRVRHAGGGRSRRPGDYVLYWMQAYRRLERNHALDCALRHAEESGKPLVIYEGLRLDYPWASARLHRFVLEGMRDNRAAAARLGLAYWPFVETEPRQGRGLVARLAERAVVVVTDDFPCFVVPDQIGGWRGAPRRLSSPWMATASCPSPAYTREARPRAPPPICAPASIASSPRHGNSAPARSRASPEPPAPGSRPRSPRQGSTISMGY